MSEKEKLLENLVEKSGKSIETLNRLITDKVNELSGLVSEEGAIYIVANELGVRLEAEKPKRDVEFTKVSEIKEAKVPVSLIVKVIKKYDKINFTSSKGTEGAVQSLLVGDEGGVIRLTVWNDQTDILENIHEGDILKITNAYTRENSQNTDRIDVHYGQYSDVEVNPEGVKIDLPEFKPMSYEFVDKKIEEIKEGDRNVKVSATITDFDIPRFYIACPTCFKKVIRDGDKHECPEHGVVDSIKVPIVNLIVDDSTGTIPVVGFRDRAEDITKMSAEQIIALTEDIDKYKTFSKKLVGAKIIIGGNASMSTMTGELQLLANQIEEIIYNEVEDKPESNNVKDEVLVDDNDLDDIEEIDLDDDLL